MTNLTQNSIILSKDLFPKKLKNLKTQESYLALTVIFNKICMAFGFVMPDTNGIILIQDMILENVFLSNRSHDQFMEAFKMAANGEISVTTRFIQVPLTYSIIVDVMRSYRLVLDRREKQNANKKYFDGLKSKVLYDQDSPKNRKIMDQVNKLVRQKKIKKNISSKPNNDLLAEQLLLNEKLKYANVICEFILKINL